MVLICGAQFVLQLDFSIVNVALPTIQADLHIAAAQLQSASSASAEVLRYHRRPEEPVVQHSQHPLKRNTPWLR